MGHHGGRRGGGVGTPARGGGVLRVAVRAGGPVRAGDPGWPPLLLCNGIGASLELLQPFVDELDPRREVIRFDMPGTGGAPYPLIPHHLSILAALLRAP